jgi:UDP-2-acetamido-3-amino-2,3-dideoxy-glucuronate N-acetyltransferase
MLIWPRLNKVLLLSEVIMSYYAHPTAIIEEGCSVGDGAKIWHFCHLMPGCTIGSNCVLGQNVVVMPGVVLGNCVKVQNNVSLYTGVVCEDDVFLGPSVVFTNIRNPRSAVSRKHAYQNTLVKKGATLGANATIICGNTIGEYAFVGAGAVITRDVPAYALVLGNPARQTGWMSAYGQPLHFDNNGLAICSESGEQYRLHNNQVTRI